MGRAIPGGELPSLHWGVGRSPWQVTTVVHIYVLLQQLMVAEDSVLCDCLPLIAFTSGKAQSILGGSFGVHQCWLMIHLPSPGAFAEMPVPGGRAEPQGERAASSDHLLHTSLGRKCYFWISKAFMGSCFLLPAAHSWGDPLLLP